MKPLFWIISFLVIFALLVLYSLSIKNKKVSQEGSTVTIKTIEKEKRHKLFITKTLKLNDSYLIELIETNVEDMTCKMSIRNLDTDENVIFYASQSQPIKGVEKFFGPRVLKVREIEKDSVTIGIRYGEIILEENGVQEKMGTGVPILTVEN